MQMVAIGAADTHLTANASVTFFRTRVQKCTNFAYESIQQKFNGATWGSEMHVTLNRTGDLIYWMYVVLELHGIAGVSSHSSNNLFRGGSDKARLQSDAHKINQAMDIRNNALRMLTLNNLACIQDRCVPAQCSRYDL